MARHLPCNGIGLDKVRNQCAFRISFSALSLRSANEQLGGWYHYHSTGNKVKKRGDDLLRVSRADAKLSLNYSLVTFSIKIFYKEHFHDENWQLCSSAETRPIVTSFDNKGHGFMTCLLKDMELLPLFLHGRESLAGPNGVMVDDNTDGTSQSQNSVVLAGQECWGSNHLMESHIFKISIGVAVVVRGKVLYVGHGWKTLRSIDLFGKHISLELFGDLCNEYDHGENIISDACVFFDISVKNAQWIPSTEPCQVPQEIVDQDAFELNQVHTHPNLKLGRDHDLVRSTFDGSYKRSIMDFNVTPQIEVFSIPSKAAVSRTQFCTLRKTITREISTPLSVRRASDSGSLELRGIVYVGSNPTYQVSVLDINNLASSMTHVKPADVGSKSQTRQYPIMSKETKKYLTGDQGELTTERNAIIDESQPSILHGRDATAETDAADIHEKNDGFLANLIQTVFGRDKQADCDATESLNAGEPYGCINSQAVPAEEAVDTVTYDSGDLLSQPNKLYGLVNINHMKREEGVTSHFQVVETLLGTFFGNLAHLVHNCQLDISVNRIWVKPSELDLCTFLVSIPDDRNQDFQYVNEVMTPFFNQSLHSIAEIAILLEVRGRRCGNYVDRHQLHRMLENLELGCGMSVYEINIEDDIETVTQIIYERHRKQSMPLRKTQSETLIYANTELSKVIGGSSHMADISSSSARNSMSVETWIRTIKDILVENGEKGLIQITSPRTSLPIGADQKWVVMMKQLLDSVRAEHQDEACAEGIKFIWPSF
ncbi:uncharacterized protein BXIN_0853 [Babesia sp. Xinjiang]|uniref:uncharacterized protein n=1 Tax=Babesia sp. Xinjiang TaxID=462227 RepID=UPI000A23FF95|nr:uncharacterized protein BXIN_0853 [Babesia sp. Xinjiang]ORM41271.1 hypothetical protein BXIN_0853 [Babesia sp. Xinjiang]